MARTPVGHEVGSIASPRVFAPEPPARVGDRSGDTAGPEAVWSRLDAGVLPPEGLAEAPAQPLSSMDLGPAGAERVGVRVIESAGGLEVQVTTRDVEARQTLLGGLDELAARVRQLSLGAIIPGLERSARGEDPAGERRQHQPATAERDERRPRTRRTGAALAFPVDAISK